MNSAGSLDNWPWGKMTGFLSACVVTLIGVVRDMDPDVILVRALGAGLIVGVMAAVAGRIVNRLLHSS